MFLMFLLKEMSYEYNAKAHYAPYGGYQELTTGEDLTKLNMSLEMITRKVRVFRSGYRMTSST